MPSDNSVDVVIPTRNRDNLLRNVIGPLLDDPAVARIIVVNDADRTVPAVRGPDLSSISPRAEVVHTYGVGPAKARQFGAEQASGEVLLFLDDDVVPDPGLPSRHAQHHEARKRLLVCGYTPITPRTPGGRLSPEAAVYSDAYERRCLEYENDPRAVLANLWGGNFSLRRVDALAVGLDSSLFLETWHEDRDFGLRCMEAGIEATYDSSIRANHEYERHWNAVLEESFRRGYSLVLLHGLHSDVIGPYDPRHFERGRIWPLRVTIRLGRHPLFRRLVLAVARLFRRLGARLHLWRLQLTAVRVLRLVQGDFGARSADAATRRA